MHWTLTEVMSLDHAQRRRWVHEIAEQIARDQEADGGGTWPPG